MIGFIAAKSISMIFYLSPKMVKKYKMEHVNNEDSIDLLKTIENGFKEANSVTKGISCSVGGYRTSIESISFSLKDGVTKSEQLAKLTDEFYTYLINFFEFEI